MRSKNALYNLLTNSILNLLNSILGLVVRKVFLIHLGSDLLGINSIYSNILAMLSLTELGFGTIVAVCLYKPIAEGDNNSIASYMLFLRKVYIFIGSFVIVAGLVLTPIVPYFITASIDNKVIYYSFAIYLFTTGTSYFFSYKRVLIVADQKGYIAQLITIACKMILNIGYLLALINKPNYYVYLWMGFLGSLIENTLVAVLCNHRYPQVFGIRNPEMLSLNERNVFLKKIKGMLYLRIGTYLINGTDNLIISKLISTNTVTYYSNYTLLVNALDAVCSGFSSTTVSSLGNLIYSDKNKLSEVMKKILWIHYFLFGMTAPLFLALSDDFVRVYFGTDSLMKFDTVILITAVYYLNGYSNGIGMIRKAVGLYEKDRFINLLIPIVNVALSVIFVNYVGVSGVLIGTFFCYSVQKVLVLPVYTSKEFPELKIVQYYKFFGLHFSLLCLFSLVVYAFSRWYYPTSLLLWVMKAVVCTLIVFILNIVVLFKQRDCTELIKYFMGARILWKKRSR